jgi:outer membrane immunogenic protein
MYRLAIVGAALLSIAGFASPASAADLAAQPYTKAPPMVAYYDWSGFYVGANGGWGSSHDCRRNATTNVAFGCHDASGGVIGGQVGYRWQSAGWVFGLEAQGNWADLRGSNISLAAPASSVRSNVDAIGLFTGQVGYAWANTLAYEKGGAAVTDTRFDVVTAATGAVTSSSGYNTNWGATVGAGLEYGFAPNWSAAVEYDHIFQTARNLRFSTPAGLLLADTFRSGGDTDLITARINYRFGGPVVARY